jgi:hypothetical protein
MLVSSPLYAERRGEERRGEERRGEIMRSWWTLPKLSKSRWSNGGEDRRKKQRILGLRQHWWGLQQVFSRLNFPDFFNLAGTQ